jgi:putative hydrolase of the HAD superfamily
VAAAAPEGPIRRLNSTDPDTNAWARYEGPADALAELSALTGPAFAGAAR